MMETFARLHHEAPIDTLAKDVAKAATPAEPPSLRAKLTVTLES
jgi:hypothetical protein